MCDNLDGVVPSSGLEMICRLQPFAQPIESQSEKFANHGHLGSHLCHWCKHLLDVTPPFCLEGVEGGSQLLGLLGPFTFPESSIQCTKRT